VRTSTELLRVGTVNLSFQDARRSSILMLARERNSGGRQSRDGAQ
jgi:hypothetical protein